MRVGAVMSDLMLFSRIDSAASAAGASLVRVDSPADLPADLDLVLVDWSARDPDWADALRVSAGSRPPGPLRPAHRSRGPRRRPRRRPGSDVGPIEAGRGAPVAPGVTARLLT